MVTTPTERPPRASAAPADRFLAPRLAGRGPRSLPAWAGIALPAAALAALLCFVAFYAKGGLNLDSMTTTELVLTLLSGVIVAAAVLARQKMPRYGSWPVGLLLALAALTAISIVWSVLPNASWQDSGRMFAYSGVFAAAVVLARLVPGGWRAVLTGVIVSAVVVCGYAVLSKIFPSTFAASNTYARLEAPYGYWNATGLTAAMGAIGCLWLGARRRGHMLLSALAYPAMGLVLLALALSYSRGAMAALLVGLVLWFAIVPLRLRGAAVLLAGAAAAAGVAAWAFSTHALSSDMVALPERTVAGRELGVLVVAMLVALAAVGAGVSFATARRAPRQLTRRRAGAALLALIAAGLLAIGGLLAHSHRGFTGSISHAVSSLTNPNAKTPPNTPDRLTAVASVRARYWKEALQVFDAHPALGAGAMSYQTARLRYRRETLVVAHAHGYVVQTLADLGLVGIAVSLVLVLSWAGAAGRCTHPFNRRWRVVDGAESRGRLRRWPEAWRGRGVLRRDRRSARPRRSVAWTPLEAAERRYSSERLGLLTMLVLVVVFGVHSLVDWTWYVPATACMALICAGWLAGRGPLAAAPAVPFDAAGAVAPRSVGDSGVGVDGDGVDGHGVDRGGTVGARRRARRAAGGLGVRLRTPQGVAAAVALAVLAAALLAAWSQWQPQRSEETRQQALTLLAAHPLAARREAEAAVREDPLSQPAQETLAEVQRLTGEPRLARATLQKSVREQPSNPRTWLALGRFNLTSRPQAAARELQAAIYLDPESVSTKAIEAGDREAIELHNEYIQALRSSESAGALRSGSGPRAGTAHGGRRAPRPGAEPSGH